MTSLFPAALDAIARPLGTTLRNAPGLNLSKLVDDLADAVEAIQGKLGSGASGSQSPPAAAGVLRRIATGQSAWGPVLGGDIAPQTITGGNMAPDRSILGAAHGVTTHIGVRTVMGTGSGGGINANIYPGSIAVDDLAVDTTAQVARASTSSTPWNVGGTAWAYDPNVLVSLTLPVAGWVVAVAMFNANCNVASSPAYFGIRRVATGAAPTLPVIHTFPVVSQATMLGVMYAESVAAGAHGWHIGVANYAAGYTTAMQERHLAVLALYR